MLPALGALAFFVAGQAAADWRYVENPFVEPASPMGFLVGKDGTIWSNTSGNIMRTGADGRTAVVLPIISQLSAGGIVQRFELRTTLPDGSVILGTREGFLRLDAQGNASWRVPSSNAWAWAANPDGVLWVIDETTLRRLGPDGRTMATTTPFDTYARPSAFAVDRAGNLIVGSDRFIAYVNRIGNTLWRKDLSDPAQNIVPADDGSFWLAGTKPTRAGSSQGALTVRRLDGLSGQERWSLAVPDLILGSVTPAPGDAGSLYLLGRRGTGAEAPGVLLRITQDGRIGWQRDLCAATSNDAVPMTVTPDGRVTVVCRVAAQTQVQRFDRDGNPAGEATLALAGPVQALWRNDTLLVSGLLNRTFGPSRMLALDRDLHPVPGPFDGVTTAMGAAIVGQHIAADGATYLATETRGYETTAYQRQLTKIAADGTRQWTQPIDVEDAPVGPLMVGSGKVCYTRWHGNVGYTIFCFADADGAPLWHRDYPAPSPYAGGATRILDNGTITVVNFFDNAFEITRIDGNGNIVANARHAGEMTPLAITPSGHVFVSVDNLKPTMALLHFDAEGRQVYAVAGSTLQSNTIGYRAAAADDGSIAIVGHLAGAPTRQKSIWFLAPDGAVRWHHDLGSEFVQMNVLRTAEAVYVRQSDIEGLNLETLPSRITRIDNAGAIRWQQRSVDREVPGYAGTAGQFALTPDGGKVMFLSNWGDRLRVQRYDAATGTRELERYIACTRACSQALDLRVTATGATLAVQLLADPVRGDVAMVNSWDNLAAPQHDVRLDQPGLTGAWWAPYANGEGFVLDWLPSSRTLFMPWFTFSIYGGNDPAGQRWYSIAGDVPANATRVELPIAEAVGGAFDDPQAVVRRQVGKATLSFTDCDNGTLQYAFDAPYNGAVAGTITLSRLTPATQDCVLADGSTQRRTVAPVNGFDARMSGSWYEEATSGQGLQFTVQPGGIFFAPWFAFDPKDAPDDPDKKRWFSIQGSLAGAVNGTVELPIAQAIGGAFDRVATNNMNIVGTAKLTMQGCDRARIDYRFDDSELAAAMRGRTGTLDLIKAGGCTP